MNIDGTEKEDARKLTERQRPSKTVGQVQNMRKVSKANSKTSSVTLSCFLKAQGTNYEEVSNPVS